MLRYKLFYCFISFSIFNPTCLFPGLFSDNIIFVLPNKYYRMKDLRPGNSITSLDDTSDQLNLCSSNVSGIRLNKNFLDTAILIILKPNRGTQSFIMVGGDQKFCISTDDYKQKKEEEADLWINAENLEKGLRLRGYNNTSLVVRDVKRINLKENVDFYEMTLNHSHTFYLVDSNGNRILTHNLFGLDDLIIIGIGCLIGGLIGGGFAAYKSYKKNILSAKTVGKGVLVGALIGGAGTTIAYYGIIAGAKYLPIIMENAETFIATHFEEVKKVIEIARQNPKVAYFVGGTITGAASAMYLFIDESICDFVDETAKRENEDIDFSEIDNYV